jgi:hypothetical protein
MLDLDHLLRLLERSFVWHAVGELMRHVDPLWIGVGLAGILLLAVLARVARPLASASVTPAYQRSTATVTCACGRRWTVRT